MNQGYVTSSLPPTEKQLDAIARLASTLGIEKTFKPSDRLEASALLTALYNEMHRKANK